MIYCCLECASLCGGGFRLISYGRGCRYRKYMYMLEYICMVAAYFVCQDSVSYRRSMCCITEIILQLSVAGIVSELLRALP